MSRRRIFILENESLLNAGIYSLLSKQENLEVVTTKHSDATEIFQIIDAFRPEVIIMDDATMIENLEALVGRLKSFPRLRTILVNGEKNELQIYDQRRIVIAEIGDFLEVL